MSEKWYFLRLRQKTIAICISLAELILRCCRYLHPINVHGSHKGDSADLQIYRKEEPECQETVLMEEADLNFFFPNRQKKRIESRGDKLFCDRDLEVFFCCSLFFRKKRHHFSFSASRWHADLGTPRDFEEGTVFQHKGDPTIREKLSFGTQNNF